MPFCSHSPGARLVKLPRPSPGRLKLSDGLLRPPRARKFEPVKARLNPKTTLCALLARRYIQQHIASSTRYVRHIRVASERLNNSLASLNLTECDERTAGRDQSLRDSCRRFCFAFRSNNSGLSFLLGLEERLNV